MPAPVNVLAPAPIRAIITYDNNCCRKVTAMKATSSLQPIAPDLSPIIRLVTDSLDSPHSRRAYGTALGEFLTWYDTQGKPGLSKATVQGYRAELQARGLAPATVNQRMSAVRKLSQEAADNGLLDQQLANGISRVKGVKQSGVRVGNWLPLEAAQALLDAPDVATRKGLRDRALLAVMIGAGLRRSEVAALTVDHVQQREGRWVIVDLVGKRRRVRSVPVPSWCKAAVDAWTAAAGILEGFLFRPVNKGDQVAGARMTAQAVRDAVKKYADGLGLDVAAHDLRRTFAKLAHKGGAGLDQIQLSLGHASIQTTERYLGVAQDLHDAPCDRLGLKLG